MCFLLKSEWPKNSPMGPMVPGSLGVPVPGPGPGAPRDQGHMGPMGSIGPMRPVNVCGEDRTDNVLYIAELL